MKPRIRFPVAAVLIIAAILVYRLAEHELQRTGFYILMMYVLALVLVIAGLLVLFNTAHKIVPDDWMP